MRGRIICSPAFLEIKQVLRGQMEAQEAEAIQPLTRRCSPLSSFAVGRRRSSLFLTDGSGGRLPAGWKSASTVHQTVSTETAGAPHRRVQEMTTIMPNVASVLVVGDGFGM